MLIKCDKAAPVYRKVGEGDKDNGDEGDEASDETSDPRRHDGLSNKSTMLVRRSFRASWYGLSEDLFGRWGSAPAAKSRRTIDTFLERTAAYSGHSPCYFKR